MTNRARYITVSPFSRFFGMLFIPLSDGRMYKVELDKIYVLGGIIHPLTGVKARTKLRDIYLLLSEADSALNNFLVGMKTPLPLCKQSIFDLKTIIHILTKHYKEDPLQFINHVESQRLRGAALRFANDLATQLNALDIYLIPQKVAYNTTTLIDKGEDLIPLELQKDLSDYAINEFRLAGKCLAFELPSAAGFHLVRALEDVVHGYYDVVTNGAPRPKDPGLGKYFESLEKNRADKKVLSALREIKNLHRNPLIHEVVLSMNEVLIFLGVAQGVIMAAIQDIRKRRS